MSGADLLFDMCGGVKRENSHTSSFFMDEQVRVF